MGDAQGHSEGGCYEEDDEEIREGKGQCDQVSLDRTAEKCSLRSGASPGAQSLHNFVNTGVGEVI